MLAEANKLFNTEGVMRTTISRFTPMKPRKSTLMKQLKIIWPLALAFSILATPALAQDTGTPTSETLENAHPQRPYSPYAGGAVPTRVFFGETHLHTSFSMDAEAIGARLGPEDAYRFARREEIESSTVGRVRLARPLDFLVVADHSDNMGWFPDLFAGAPNILADPTGYSFSGFPTVGFNSDEGTSVGLIGSLYYNAEGGYNPYFYTLEADISISTGGSQEAALFFDSPYLLGQGQRLTSEIRYERFDPLFYYGIGNDTPYDEALTDSGSTGFISEDYYSFERQRFTLWGAYQRQLGSFKLHGGLGLAYTTISLFEGETVLGTDDVLGKDGGFTNYVKVGVIYDTRDFEPAPSRGDWTDLLLEVSNGVLGSDYDYTRLTLTNRHYFPLRKNLVFAERIVIEKSWGDMPFYEMGFFNSTFKVEEGLGGAKTIRGHLRNRFMGPSKVFGNLELRWRFWDFQKFKQDFYLALSGFLDYGRVWEEGESFSLEGFHTGQGVGLHLGWNETFIVSIDMGTSNEINSAVYFTIGYLY